MSAKEHNRVAIIGSGPAGLTAAIYSARAMLEPVVFEGPEPGGQLTTTTEIENFPGFPDPITGPELIANMKKQAERFGATFRSGIVTDVDFSSIPLKLVQNDQTWTADAVIIAAGASANWLGLESEQKLRGHGVSACATCDGFFFKGKEIAVVGGGDSAIEEALFLTKFATKVTIIHRRDELRASKIMRQKAFDNPAIEIAWDSVVEEVLDIEKNDVTGARLRNVKTNEERVLPCRGFFLAIGHTPNAQVFQGKLDTDENGYLITTPGRTQTSVPGVFAAGDVRDHTYRQAITAAGSGCMAAIEAERLLADRG